MSVYTPTGMDDVVLLYSLTSAIPLAIFTYLYKMNVSTSLPLQFSHAADGKRSDVLWHSSYDGSTGLFGDMLGLGVTRDSIGHTVADLASVTRLEVAPSVDSVGDVSGELLFVSG